ncbi:leucine-rich repeat-containing protein 40-like [Homalodisca vitripennis]|uniref:leucine-rich repeat-containing protein 40-like n=1 Tax=Homalodisca vitripennis TaxID=197043 RepID=UPI001EEA8B1F|nr:leucine-rich repeat-containing protein 40-like [Homalodisca vitripennis]
MNTLKMAAQIDWTKFVGLQKIDLSQNIIHELPSGVSQCDGLESLKLNHNELGDLPEDIGDLKCLKVLNLNNNKLFCLPQCIFKISTLLELTVSDNLIKTVHKDVGNLCDLTTLDISHNKLITLTAGVGFLNRLKHVNLSNNELQTIPHELTTICGLVEIDVSCNKLKKLPCVRNLIHLKIFKANSNQLKNLPDFSQCRELVVINVSHNLIEEIDSAGLNSQPFLKEVILQSNRIKELPSDITSLSSLQILDVSSNNLSRLPSSIVDFPNLQLLRIMNNPLKNFPPQYMKADTVRLLGYLRERFAYELEAMIPEDDHSDPVPVARFSLSQLRRCGSLVHTNSEEDVPDEVWDNAVKAQVVVVNLSHSKQFLSNRVVELAESLMELHLVDTGMKELPPCVGKLRELQILILDQNHLSDLCPELAGCKYMKELSLSCNRFSEIPLVVYQLRLLRTLVISNNKLSTLELAWSGLLSLQNLDTLNLSNNEITQLPAQLGLMTHLKSFEVTGNKFRQPSYQVLSKGTETVLAYLRNKLPEDKKEEGGGLEKNEPTSVSYFIA